ncbi:hypothetical protein [Phreatobacter sp.]|uniref:hypothetical protein n=1 Tax=Phreatobacter sp. TaxID=1966341 RepID=UPI0022BD19CB|nr:hypothetical protein [Phreatobacter sp.]MCZ8315833.1 hypothetical protein [Phreatobacter sp.]
MRTTQDNLAGRPIRLADRQCARSGLTQAAICLALALALGACSVSRDAARSATGQTSGQVEPKVPVRDYPSQH